jgi:hypothetical protein
MPCAAANSGAAISRAAANAAEWADFMFTSDTYNSKSAM